VHLLSQQHAAPLLNLSTFKFYDNNGRASNLQCIRLQKILILLIQILDGRYQI